MKKSFFAMVSFVWLVFHGVFAYEPNADEDSIFESGGLDCVKYSTYHNPIDGMAYTADWKTYSSESEVKNANERVVTDEIRLLSPEDEFEKNTTAEELVAFIDFIDKALEISVENSKDSGSIILQVTINHRMPPKYQIAYEGSLEQEILQKFYDEISKLSLQTKVGSVVFQLAYTVNDIKDMP